MKIRTRSLTGTAIPWDPASPGEFIVAAGSQFTAVDGQDALVRDVTGYVIRIRPGWWCVRVDGTPAAHFTSQRDFSDGTRIWDLDG